MFEDQRTHPEVERKMHSEKRILVVRAKEGKDPINGQGIIDKRLFNGEPNLSAVRGPFDNLWRLKFEKGSLPVPLRQSFTNIKQLMDYTTGYFNRRNCEIVEVLDDHSYSNG